MNMKPGRLIRFVHIIQYQLPSIKYLVSSIQIVHSKNPGHAYVRNVS